MKTFSMNFILQRGLILLLTATSTQASLMGDVLKKTFASRSTFKEGGMNGGGGRAVVCRNNNGSIKSAELLDLYEARTIYGLTLRNAKPSFEEDLRFSFTKLLIHFSSDLVVNKKDIDESIDLMMSTTTFISLPNKLNQVDDSEEPVVPWGCTIEQVAHFYEDDRLIVQKEIYDAFDVLSKSALFTHEGSYYLAREIRSDSTSRSSRKFVGIFYSTEKLTPIRNDYYKLNQEKGNIQCFSIEDMSSHEVDFVMKKKSDGKIQIEFSNLFNSLFYKVNTQYDKDNNEYFYEKMMTLLTMEPQVSKIENQELLDHEFLGAVTYNYEFSSKYTGNSMIIIYAKRVVNPVDKKYFINEFKVTHTKINGKPQSKKMQCFIIGGKTN